MAESTKVPPQPGRAAKAARATGAHARSEPKYALPMPLRTFPLPTFYPSNPLSLAHLAVVWLGQVFFPPPPAPAVVYTGVWSAVTRSVHVTDPRAMHDLWCQGFFGKGSLSRSEPSWLNREKARRGLVYETSEQRTAKRREERADTKWERGRNELEAIEQRRLRELAVEKEAAAAEVTFATAAAASPADSVADRSRKFAEPADVQKFDAPTKYTAKPPVGPLELLALPNSQAELLQILTAHKTIGNGLVSADVDEIKPPVGPLELLALPNSQAELLQILAAQKTTNCSLGSLDADESRGVQTATATATATAPQHNGSVHRIDSTAVPRDGDRDTGIACDAMGLPTSDDANGSSSSAATPLFSDNEGSSESPTPPCSKQQKSVRFSPTIESTTFQHSDPPSRNTGATASSQNGDLHQDSESLTADTATIQNKEHLQLSAEEAFFLAYALGTLEVRDPAADNAVLSTEQLFRLFRQHSYFPPRTGSDQPLAPDDPFLVHYAVYHHFRSLGWVPRHGIKFGVDWLLYGKGPALDHAPFGVVVVPSYSDPRWRQQQQKQPPRKSWHWLHSVNRVLTTVYKSMVMVYVDIPAPLGNEADGATALLQRYRIREVMVRRWSSNRNRD